MRKLIYYQDEETKKWKYKVFDTDKSTFLCHTPQGDLFQKRGSSKDFFTWKSKDEDPVTVSWAEANSLVKTYGSRELHLSLFTTWGTSTDQKDGKSTQVRLDSYHRLKAQRNADRLKLSMQGYIYRLIDKDDASNNWCK